jgi:AraC family transcriptional regulator
MRRTAMSDNTNASLSVSIKELESVHVAYTTYKAKGEQGDMHAEIHECFQRVQNWLSGVGLDPLTLLHVGIPILRSGEFLSYECCIEVPAEVHTGLDDIGIKELPGGRYAIVNIEKEPAIIGDSIGRFYQEYVPHNHLVIDGMRPTYEIYYASTMEYCVPIL